MRRRPACTFALPLLAAGALWLSTAPALAGVVCPAFDPPRVKVTPQIAPLLRDHTRTIAELATIPGRAPGPAGRSNGHILGLAHARYGEESQFRAMFRSLANGDVCGAPATLAVTFGFQERRLFVARELPRESCIHGEVLRHEMKHIAVDEMLLKEFIPRIQQRLEAVVQRVGTVRRRTQEQAMAAIRQPIDAALKLAMQEFTRERDRRQRQVDSAEEYARVTRSCGGELTRYLPKAGKPRM
ncbi:hypothetical protein HL658_24335 [Azospirillum sp. RWY-5-1]|uniref:DUF922 domain-containing protein n=1 Tax=Azospirillum oleiclasticum TaxID=2735135 RepID=A0ABX2TFI1_9PROT|nr:hypothetical protein [Azospirillum oleiclasticum]NYZ15682.1 hypothetical protein [Azospirillum oleiclasticum]NYZ21952.1 hypothetical protein [Azospirillum oleiclasticum]